MTVTVLTAVTGTWEAPLVAGLERSIGQVRVARRCADLAELLAAAGAGLGQAVLVSADLDRLDRAAVAEFAACGVAVVGIVDPATEDAGRRLSDLGVVPVLLADTPPDQVAQAVLDAVARLARRPPSSTRRGRRSSGVLARADPGDALPQVAENAAPSPEATPRPSGTLIAVWGPVGAPGRTTVAVTLATELAALGAQTLLIDADTYGPSVAQTLGLLDESGGIAGAVRAANHGSLDLDRLAQLAPSLHTTLRVLTGLPQPGRWAELRPSGLEVVWQRARGLAAWTVVDCGFGLEADEELSFDTAAPRRNGATLSALAHADVVLAVGSADPVGLHRLIQGLGELAEVLGPGARPQVVVTRVRSGAVGPQPERRIGEALARHAGVTDPLLIPDDRAGCDAVMLAGRTLLEAAPTSPARRPLTEYAALLEAGLLPGGAAPAGSERP